MQQINQIIIEGIVDDIYDEDTYEEAEDFTIIHSIANSNRSFKVHIGFDCTKINYVASKGDKIRVVGKLAFITDNLYYIRAEHIEVAPKKQR